VEYPNAIGSGSGFVIESNSQETLIVTNYHVVGEDPSEISVWIGEEELAAAEIVAGSEQKDLCILRLNIPTKLRKLTLANR
jgi:S1-C subfamily serine protease